MRNWYAVLFLTLPCALAVAWADRSAHATRFGSTDLFWTHDGDTASRCVAFSEPADPASWNDNALCGRLLPDGTRFSNQGPIEGMRCTAIVEPADPHTWDDNFLCVPIVSEYSFVWSHSGRPQGNRLIACVPTPEPADPHTWNDNHLCLWAPGAAMRSLENTIALSGALSGEGDAGGLLESVAALERRSDRVEQMARRLEQAEARIAELTRSLQTNQRQFARLLRQFRAYRAAPEDDFYGPRRPSQYR